MNMKSSVRAGAAVLAAIATSAALAQTVLPLYVDLSATQSPEKSQDARDTCGTFATVAALEALYRRTHGVSLDLSEQYLNHWAQQFASAGSGKALPLNETVVGSVGGGGLARPLAALSRGLSVPLEDTTTVRLKVEQNQLLSVVCLRRSGLIAWEGA